MWHISKILYWWVLKLTIIDISYFVLDNKGPFICPNTITASVINWHHQVSKFNPALTSRKFEPATEVLGATNMTVITGCLSPLCFWQAIRRLILNLLRLRWAAFHLFMHVEKYYLSGCSSSILISYKYKLIKMKYHNWICADTNLWIIIEFLKIWI